MRCEVVDHSVTALSSSYRKGAQSIPGATHDGQDVKEDVDDVGVEVKSCIDVLLWANGHFLVPQ